MKRLALAGLLAFAVFFGWQSAAQALGPYHYCKSDATSVGLNGPNDTCTDSGGSHINLISTQARVDSGTTGRVCVRMLNSGGSPTYASANCSPGYGTGQQASQSSPSCGYNGYARLGASADSPYGFQAHGFFYRYSGSNCQP